MQDRGVPDIPHGQPGVGGLGAPSRGWLLLGQAAGEMGSCRTLRGWFSSAIVTLSLAGCLAAPVAPSTRKPPATPAAKTTAAAAQWPNEEWATSTPEEQGMDSQRLAEMFETIRERSLAVDSVTVIRNGTMVADATVYPFSPDSRHVIHSCTKSIVSALVGIAIHQGHLEGLEQPILDIFQDRRVARIDADKRAMTLEHVLMMASGLECRDSYLYRWRGLQEMRQSDDWVQFMLDLPMGEPPGARFEYCNGGSFLLSAAIQITTGLSALEFAQEHLFGPLGIDDVEWPANPQGISIGWGELRMRPHDMARIGYLYLNEGEWNGQQIVPTEWVRVSTQKHISATLQDGYGYQWWIADRGAFMALGYAGQYIVVVPEQDLVVVFTSDLAEEQFYVPQQLLYEFVFSAAESDTPLSANPVGVARLKAAAEALARP